MTKEKTQPELPSILTIGEEIRFLRKNAVLAPGTRVRFLEFIGVIDSTHQVTGAVDKYEVLDGPHAGLVFSVHPGTMLDRIVHGATHAQLEEEKREAVFETLQVLKVNTPEGDTLTLGERTQLQYMRQNEDDEPFAEYCRVLNGPYTSSIVILNNPVEKVAYKI